MPVHMSDYAQACRCTARRAGTSSGSHPAGGCAPLQRASRAARRGLLPATASSSSGSHAHTAAHACSPAHGLARLTTRTRTLVVRSDKERVVRTCVCEYVCKHAYACLFLAGLDEERVIGPAVVLLDTPGVHEQGDHLTDGHSLRSGCLVAGGG